jgi:hypothetical protein
MPLDTLRSIGAKMFLNKQFDYLGEVIDVEIDPKLDAAVLLVALKGETERVRLEVSYRVEPEALVLEHFRCEREWIENTLNRFFAGHRFDIGDGLIQALVKHLL